MSIDIRHYLKPSNPPPFATQAMNSLCLPSPSTLFLPPLKLPQPSLHHLQTPHPHHRLQCKCTPSLTTFSPPEPEGPVSVVDFSDLTEKDWSFLEQDPINTPSEQTQKTNLIISSGELESNSKVLVSLPSEGFVDYLVEKSVKGNVIVVVHESLFVLAGVKEMYDNVQCWLGELVDVPSKWSPFDVVFLNYLPGLGSELDRVFRVVAENCSEGARLVISYPQGREGVERQRKEHPDVVISDLPHKLALEKAASDHSFEITKFLDEPGLYLAVLQFSGPSMHPQ